MGDATGLFAPWGGCCLRFCLDVDMVKGFYRSRCVADSKLGVVDSLGLGRWMGREGTAVPQRGLGVPDMPCLA